MKTVVIINTHSGRARRGQELGKLLAALNRIPEVEPHFLAKGEDPTALAKRLSQEGAAVVGAAGGDGTLNAVANGLAETETALAVIPFGTLNHFAQDLGIPPQPEEAARLLLSPEAAERKIDLGKVNGRYFLNNSSLGLYPHLVRLREKNEAHLGKWPAYVLAAFSTLRYPVYAQVSLPVAEAAKPLRVWLVFVANNQIELKLPRPGYRARLDEGCLDLYVLRASHPVALVWTAFRFAFGRLDRSHLLREHHLKQFEIHTQKRRRVNVACDGEVFRMHPPVRYEVVPGALKVRCLPD
jgi:diacylglycerol kinase family enzyme